MSEGKITIDDLARMVQNGFAEVKTEMVQMREEMRTMKEDNAEHFKIIENAQTDIKLRQDNVAYRFELNALDKRVTQLEKSH